MIESKSKADFNQKLKLSRPIVMGILNVTPDSFSDGSKFMDTDKAYDHAVRMVESGADIIDIGGESSRPGAEPVDMKEELKRVLPVIEKIRKHLDTMISIDTCHAETARKAIDSGADIVNDISALRFDPEMVKVIADKGSPVILMHIQGTPRDMQLNPHYDDCVAEILTFFDERISFAEQNGIRRSDILIDPGIGFGKRLNDNLDILANLSKFKKYGLPVVVGTSRKSFIGMITNSDKPADRRIGGSIISALTAIDNGADIVRVHDVYETVEAIKVLQAIRGAR